MTTIAILGSGTVAKALAGALVKTGHSIVIGSRTPGGRAAQWAPPVTVTGLAEAAETADLAINATPGGASVALLTGLADHLAGKILVDTANAVIKGPDGLAGSLVYPGGSLAEEIQRALPDTAVVKTLNTIGPAEAMVAPGMFATPPTAFLSGDDSAAKEIVADLLVDLTWPRDRIVDLGEVTTARVPEAFILLVRPLIQALGPRPLGLAVAV